MIDAIGLSPDECFPVVVVTPFKEARTPCPPAGHRGFLFGFDGKYCRVRFNLPLTCTQGYTWGTHFDTPYMDLKFLTTEIALASDE